MIQSKGKHVASSYDISQVDMSAWWTSDAFYSVDIMLNGLSIWSASDSVSGVDFDMNEPPVTKVIPELSGTFNLGIYDVGDTFTLEYEISTTTTGFEHGISSVSLFSMDGAVAMAHAPVPEPTTMILFGIGLLGFAGVDRRKK